MADSNITQTTLAFSRLNEPAFNSAPVTAADYVSYETTARILPLPDAEKQQDVARIGAGSASAYPTTQRTGVLSPTTLEISDVVNVEKLPIFTELYMGKPEVVGDVVIVEAAKAWRHIQYKRNYDLLGRQLPSKSWIVRNNGADFIYTGGVGATIQFQQQGITDPTFSFGVVTGGSYLRISALAAFGAVAVPTRNQLKDMMGAETILSYNDGALRTLNGRWKSFTFSGNNNIDTGDLRAGLPRVGDAACPTRGWYRTQLLAGDETVTAEFRVAHDDVLREWDNAQTNTDVTNFDILMRGACVPTSAANQQYSTKVSVGHCFFRNVRGGDDNNLAVNDVGVFPVRNGSYYGVWKVEYVTDQAGVLQPTA